MMALEAHLRERRDAGRKLLVPYVTGGLGDAWGETIEALAQAGADAIEVGVPFSDPVMDGPVIQQASAEALAAGATPDTVFDRVAQLDLDVPLVTMQYYNTVFRAGHERYAARLRGAGISGAIVPDLPFLESGPWRAAAVAEGLDTVLFGTPLADDAALAALTAKKNLRVLTAAAPGGDPHHVRTIDGGLLVQRPDAVSLDRDGWRVVTERTPTDDEWIDLELAWVLGARVTSNAIVLVKGGQAVGIGAGQQSRVDASRIAADKADGRAVGGACSSDAFFPFRDGIDAAAAAGAAAVIQPGGSVRDDEVIAAADEHGMAMVLTGERHFRH